MSAYADVGWGRAAAKRSVCAGAGPRGPPTTPARSALTSPETDGHRWVTPPPRARSLFADRLERRQEPGVSMPIPTHDDVSPPTRPGRRRRVRAALATSVLLMLSPLSAVAAPAPASPAAPTATGACPPRTTSRTDRRSTSAPRRTG